MKPVRIMLVDDHPLIREAIGHVVASAPDFELVGEAANGPVAEDDVHRAGMRRPELIRIDDRTGVVVPLGAVEIVGRIATRW